MAACDTLQDIVRDNLRGFASWNGTSHGKEPSRCCALATGYDHGSDGTAPLVSHSKEGRVMQRFVLISFLALAAPVTAQRGTTSTYAPGCGGATLTAAFQPIAGGGGAELLVLQATGLHPRAFGAMAWGHNQAQIEVFPNCFVALDPIWSITFQTDANGSHTWSRAWPRSIGGHFLIQMGSVQGPPLDVKLTNAIRADSNN